MYTSFDLFRESQIMIFSVGEPEKGEEIERQYECDLRKTEENGASKNIFISESRRRLPSKQFFQSFV